MNHDPSMVSWQGQLPDEEMASHNRPDEFTDLLNFDFDFTTLDNVVSQPGQSMPSTTAQLQTTMMQDVQLTSMDPIQTTQPSSYGQMQPMDVQGSNGAVNTNVQSQFYASKQPQQQSMVPHNYGQGQTFIPPTPNSMEMHGRVSNYPMRIETESRRIYEPYTRSTDDQSAFTPLISPAMTPLEQQYRLPEYTIPGEYFTPLTSPALEGRNPNNNFLFNNPSHIDMNFVSSPMEFPAHMSSSTAPPSPGAVRKSRRKLSFQARTGTRLLRQSPSVRPLGNRQRPQIPTGSQSEDTSNSQATTPANRSSLYLNSSSNESSCQDSVSPEPLSEPLMPPPALPRTNGRSPHIPAQESQQAQGRNQGAQTTHAPSQSATPAATPATLMRLQSQHRDPSQTPFSRSGSVIVNDASDEVMEDISLPEPASGPVQSTSSERTPSITPKPTPAPNSARPGTASTGPSPQIGAMPSPAGPVGLKRSDSKQPSARTTKKRQSTHSAQISPALRPKMSPSLKPLLKGSDSMSAETSALYLASKSNYQHILDGTVLPGVTYPESLAENLSSKRTNHKLAEQGRRNRINTALKEIESLLPPWLARGAAKDKDGKEKGRESNANGSNKSPDKPAATQPISKASTVEMAIVYIKSLQQQLAQTQEKLKAAEQKLGEKNGATKPSTSDSDAHRQVESDEKSTTTKPDASNSAEPEKAEVAKSPESDQPIAK